VPIEERYCTLLGGKTQGGWIGSTVAGLKGVFWDMGAFS